MDELMTTRTVADRLGMSVRWVEARVADGSLPAVCWDTGRPVWRVQRSDLEAFVARHQRAAGQQHDEETAP